MDKSNNLKDVKQLAKNILCDIISSRGDTNLSNLANILNNDTKENKLEINITINL